MARVASEPTTRRALWTLVLGVLAVRVAYLVLLCPYELAGDEAHYWEWSRRPALSYYSKGPGVAWAIAASTAAFGTHAWSVRLPAVVSAAIGMLALAELTRRVTGGDRRAGLYAAALYALTPAFIGVAQFMTIDSPYLACWAVSALLGWMVYERQRDGRPAAALWLLLGLMMGVTFLFKYLVLMMAPGLVAFWLLRGRSMRWRGSTSLNAALWVVGGTIAVSPVLVWNHLHDWPTLRHALGHMQVAGGDVDVPDDPWSPLWPLEMVGSQVLIIGPPIVALIVLGVRRAWRRRKTAPGEWTATLYLLWLGLPMLMFFFLFTFRGRIQVNWPIAGFVSMLVIPAMYLPAWMDEFRAKMRAWLASEQTPKPKQGFLRRRPENWAQVLWHWTIGVGVGAAFVIALLPYVRFMPGLSDVPGLDRITGHRARALEVETVIGRLQDAGANPLIMCDHYAKASLLAFYLPGRPRVYCPAAYMGKRHNQYDFFDDVDLADPAIRGRTAVLVDNYPAGWADALRFDRIEPAAGAKDVYIGFGYGGLKTDARN